MDRLEDLLERIRDPRKCYELLLGAPRGEARIVARQLAAVLSSLPAVHRELGTLPGRLAAVGELVRRAGVLELSLLNLARQRKRELAHGIPAERARHPRATRGRRVRDVGRLALL